MNSEDAQRLVEAVEQIAEMIAAISATLEAIQLHLDAARDAEPTQRQQRK